MVFKGKGGCGLANWGSCGPYREKYGPTELVDLDRTFPGTVFIR